MDSNYHNQNVTADSENPFASASLILGILAFLSICTGILPFIFGGLSILFAVLSKRRQKPLLSSAFIGVAGSSISMVLSFVIIAVSIIQLPQMLNDPATRAQLDATSEALYGVTFDEMLENSGIDLDSILKK